MIIMSTEDLVKKFEADEYLLLAGLLRLGLIEGAFQLFYVWNDDGFPLNAYQLFVF